MVYLHSVYELENNNYDLEIILLFKPQTFSTLYQGKTKTKNLQCQWTTEMFQSALGSKTLRIRVQLESKAVKVKLLKKLDNV